MPQDFWETEGYWEVAAGEGGERQKLCHVDGTEVKLPAEVPDDAEVKDPSLFYKASIGKGMVMVPIVKILQSPENEEARKKLEVPFWLEAVPQQAEETPPVGGRASDGGSTTGGISTPSTVMSPATPRHEAPPPPGFGGALGST